MYGNNGGGFQPRGMDSLAPVSVGEEIDVKIEAVGEKGDGIARKKGFVLFIPNTQAGDEVRIKITKVLRKVGFAEAIGKAQGPIEEDAPPKQRQPSRHVVGDAPVAAPEPAPEDSDDFGAEFEEADDTLPPVEEPAPEPVSEDAPVEPEAPVPPADDSLEVPPPPPVDEAAEEKKEE